MAAAASQRDKQPLRHASNYVYLHVQRVPRPGAARVVHLVPYLCFEGRLPALQAQQCDDAAEKKLEDIRGDGVPRHHRDLPLRYPQVRGRSEIPL